MLSYLTRRILLMLVTLLGISVLIFLLMRLVPGNVADALMDASGSVDPSDKIRIERELGLDLPLWQQYLAWIGALAHGSLGYSYVTERPAAEEILPRIPVSATLAGLSLLISVAIGVPLGVISAVRQNGLVDNALRMFSIGALSLPSFWLGLLVLMASVTLFGTAPIYAGSDMTMGQQLLVLSVPATVVGLRSSALVMRFTRSSVLEVLRQDFIRTARAKGASERTVHYRHALKNAVLPIVTIIGIEAAYLIGGLVVAETVFNVPGVARYLVDAIRWRDYPIVQNLAMFIAIIVVTVNLLVDLAYAVVDPRIKLGA